MLLVDRGAADKIRLMVDGKSVFAKRPDLVRSYWALHVDLPGILAPYRIYTLIPPGPPPIPPPPPPNPGPVPPTTPTTTTGPPPPKPDRTDRTTDSYSSDSDTDSDTDTDTDTDTDDMTLTEIRAELGLIRGGYSPKLGDIVEVFWVGEGKWFEGEVIGVKKGLYRVFYKFDSEKHWHDSSARVRLKK